MAIVIIADTLLRDGISSINQLYTHTRAHLHRSVSICPIISLTQSKIPPLLQEGYRGKGFKFRLGSRACARGAACGACAASLLAPRYRLCLPPFHCNPQLRFDVRRRAIAVLPTGLWEPERRGMNQEKRKREARETHSPCT